MFCHDPVEEAVRDEPAVDGDLRPRHIAAALGEQKYESVGDVLALAESTEGDALDGDVHQGMRAIEQGRGDEAGV